MIYVFDDQTYLCFRSLTMNNGWIKLRTKLLVEYREEMSQFLEVAKFHVDDW